MKKYRLDQNKSIFRQQEIHDAKLQGGDIVGKGENAGYRHFLFLAWLFSEKT